MFNQRKREESKMKKTKIIDIVQALETRGIKTGIGKGNGINGDYIELT